MNGTAAVRACPRLVTVLVLPLAWCAMLRGKYIIGHLTPTVNRKYAYSLGGPPFYYDLGYISTEYGHSGDNASRRRHVRCERLAANPSWEQVPHTGFAPLPPR